MIGYETAEKTEKVEIKMEKKKGEKVFKNL